jgi:hypothetical protein
VAVGAAGVGAGAPAEPEVAGAFEERPPTLRRRAPVPEWRCVLEPELGCERLLPGADLRLWEQVCFVELLASFRAGGCLVVAPAGGQPGVALLARGSVVAAGLVVVGSAGVDACCFVGTVFVDPAGAPLADCAACAVPPPIQPFTALDMTSVLAIRDSRERQPG